jgi:hypothetical protein
MTGGTIYSYCKITFSGVTSGWYKTWKDYNTGNATPNFTSYSIDIIIVITGLPIRHDSISERKKTSATRSFSLPGDALEYPKRKF